MKKDEKASQSHQEESEEITLDTAEMELEEGAEESKENAKKDEIEALKKELEACREKEMRCIAEFDNYRKRTAKEKIQSRENAIADCAQAFLPVLDNLERAVSAQQDSSFKEGVQMILEQFREALHGVGITEVPAQGVTFDPELHNAVNQVEDEKFDQNTVCEVFQKGYQIGDKVIRHAAVSVANP